MVVGCWLLVQVVERERCLAQKLYLVKDEQDIDIVGHTMCMAEARRGLCC